LKAAGEEDAGRGEEIQRQQIWQAFCQEEGWPSFAAADVAPARIWYYILIVQNRRRTDEYRIDARS
jgi:hypothetical protein